jgi:broad specificity phosphatase PhoE
MAGLHVTEIEKDGLSYEQWLTDPSQMTIPGGETFSQINERVSRALKCNCRTRTPAQVVAHEIVIKWR